MTDTMRAYVISEPGGPERLELRAIQRPSPRDGWVLKDFHPMGDVPTGVKLALYSGEASDITCAQFQRYVSLVEPDELVLKPGPSFHFGQLREAHATMDENRAVGKL